MTPPAGRQTVSPLGQIIPMYAYPANLPNGYRGDDEWTACSMRSGIDAPTFVVANVANGVVDAGPPRLPCRADEESRVPLSLCRDENYRKAIAECAGRGARLLGYVNLEWGEAGLGATGSDDPSTVLGQVRLWFGLYPGISGVFLDQVPPEGTPAARRYQRAIAANVPGTVVVNAGQLPTTDWLLDSGADLVVYENYVAEFGRLRLPSWTSRYAPRHLGAILHDVTSPAEVAETCAEARAKGFGFVYTTDGCQCSGNPYDGLPSGPIWEALTASRQGLARREPGCDEVAGWSAELEGVAGEDELLALTGAGGES